MLSMNEGALIPRGRLPSTMFDAVIREGVPQVDLLDDQCGGSARLAILHDGFDLAPVAGVRPTFAAGIAEDEVVQLSTDTCNHAAEPLDVFLDLAALRSCRCPCNAEGRPVEGDGWCARGYPRQRLAEAGTLSQCRLMAADIGERTTPPQQLRMLFRVDPPIAERRGHQAVDFRERPVPLQVDVVAHPFTQRAHFGDLYPTVGGDATPHALENLHVLRDGVVETIPLHRVDVLDAC